MVPEELQRVTKFFLFGGEKKRVNLDDKRRVTESYKELHQELQAFLVFMRFYI